MTPSIQNAPNTRHRVWQYAQSQTFHARAMRYLRSTLGSRGAEATSGLGGDGGAIEAPLPTSHPAPRRTRPRLCALLLNPFLWTGIILAVVLAIVIVFATTGGSITLWFCIIILIMFGFAVCVIGEKISPPFSSIPIPPPFAFWKERVITPN